MKVAWKEHFVFPEHKRDSHVCSWDAIFVDNLAAAYYRFVLFLLDIVYY